MKAKTQKILAAGAALALLGIMAASLLLRRDRVVERTDFLMSTVVDQKITGREAEKTGDRVVEMLQELEHTLSLYDEASEIAAVNAAAGRNAVTVSEGTYKLLKRSTALSAETGRDLQLGDCTGNPALARCDGSQTSTGTGGCVRTAAAHRLSTDKI